MNTQAMLENATEEGQTSMIKEFVNLCAAFDRAMDEDGFRTFCGDFKYENNLGHVRTPNYIE